MRRVITGAIFLVASLVITVAQQPPQPQEQKPASPPAPGAPAQGGPRGGGTTPGKPIVPVAASTVLAHPDQYIG